MATVMASEELAHGQITSGRSPRAWNTLRKASQDDIDPVVIHTDTHSQTSKSKQRKSMIISCDFRVFENLQMDSHGLAPSATISIRSELRLMSLWSLWASRDQCMSLDFTTATRAVQGTKKTKSPAQNRIIQSEILNHAA